MEVKLIDHMGTDLSVVNAARISFGKRKEVFDESDEKLIKYLAKNGHFSPLCHNSITFNLIVPRYISEIINDHKIGFVFTEKSRNCENYEPVFYGNDENNDTYLKIFEETKQKYGLDKAINNLPNSVMSSWYLTGNVYSFSKLYNFHKNGDSYELKWILTYIGNELSKLFPVSWKALTNN